MKLKRGNRNLGSLIVSILVFGTIVSILLSTKIWEAFLGTLYPNATSVVYARASIARLFGEHLVLVGVSSVSAAMVGISVGVFVTRTRGRPFREIVNDLGSLSQTIPPVAVLALAVPAVGFGFEPTVLALFLYSVLPILRNTVSGLEDVSPDVIDAGRGMGMTQTQLLFKAELPLATPVIFAGIRISVVINVGTATIGAVVGAGGLGNPIISGLINNNPAYILQGAITAALLALLMDLLIGRLEKSLSSK